MLRTLTLLGLLAASTAVAQAADQTGDPEDGPVQFAPGADGGLGISIPDVLEEAERLGEAWEESLDIQSADSFERDYDMEALRDRALNNPRVRALLGAEGDDLTGEAEEQRYGSKHVFLMASFSMPDTVLRPLMQEAIALDVPVIFRGFVNNSVFDTQAALQETFGDDAELVGFGIDPTLFARFGVDRVPTVIVAAEELDVCETQGCEGDPVPAHDRLTGNIPLRAALEIIARGEGDATRQAMEVLATHPVLP
ncbi:type-F conjugative transfer system pilin assembly protein TrbC [Loktanella sp. IMCC34160]|uniref:type-F conjugative transfer system pilin assembly protein TrbC n=1 Tax=Loktanella sp. IMCC34160 TaxID=2510646 RepID=UPI00101D79A6|nr:type-F conjugative transfer system pilin assembly protein TrbC [Loktanella sp. IMCC34160]RYG89910.1 type-F conjugative transfer system pilin assembly protein TrbC [Loktanella sp. IMCC34160]